MRRGEYTFGGFSFLASAYLNAMPFPPPHDLSKLVGVRCKHCGKPNIPGLIADGSTWFATDEVSLELALNSIKHHLSSSQCLFAHNQQMKELMNGSGRTANPAHKGTMSLSMFVSWYCNTHRLFGTSSPTLQQVQYQQQRQQQQQQLQIESFEELGDALSQAFSHHFFARLEPGTEIVFKNLNEIPCLEYQKAESPFVAELLDCLEMVRTKHGPSETQVVIQCRYCHGGPKSDAQGLDRPFLVTNEFINSNKETSEAVGWMQVMGYSHLRKCNCVSRKIQTRLHRLCPGSQELQFKTNAQDLHERFKEWLKWINKTILRPMADCSENTNSVEDVELFVPLTGDMIADLGSDYLEPDSMVPEPPALLSNWEQFGVRHHDVVVDEVRARNHAGNKQFRMLVSKFRREHNYLSSGRKLQEGIARSMVATIRERGGSIGILDGSGIFKQLNMEGQVKICINALDEGVPSLLRPITKKRGRGSFVLECEVAPHYGLLQDKVVWPNVNSGFLLDPLRRKRSRSEDFAVAESNGASANAHNTPWTPPDGLMRVRV